MTKQKLLLGAKNGGEQRIKMTREEIISMLSTELDEKWDNGITCLMVEDAELKRRIQKWNFLSKRVR